MNLKSLVSLILLGTVLCAMVLTSSCCVGKLFEDDDDPYVLVED